jgi:hypothetical protein
MVRVPSNSNLTPGGAKEFPAGVASGRPDLARSGQISQVRQGPRRWGSESGSLFAAVWP